MRESKLKEYFEDSFTAELLSEDLKDSQKKTGYDVTTVNIDSIIVGEFEIKREHLVKLCNDTIDGRLQLSDLNTIGFALMTSEFFYWNEETEDGKIIEAVIFDWDNPEMEHDLIIKNVALWKEYLLTGNYKFDTKELKRKRKS